MLKKLLLVFIVIASISFGEEDFIGDILSNGFGINLRVGLVSFGYQQKIYIKSFNGDIQILAGDKLIRVNDKETVEINNRDGEIEINGEKYSIATIKKVDIIAVIGVSSDNKNYRKYRGSIDIFSDKGKNGIVLVNDVLAEEYLYSVVACEIDSDFGDEAIKAQAVAARTYLYSSLKIGKHAGYDLVDTTADQVYKGVTSEKELVNKLVNDTANEVIVYNDEPIVAYYHSNSGGKTANIEDVWIGSKSIPYLRAVADCDNVLSYYGGSWNYKISKQEIDKRFKLHVESINLSDVRDGRVIKADIGGKTFSGADIRRIVGYSSILSTMFEVADDGEFFIFKGKGSGHGVGMSQSGASELSKRGYSYLDILKYYYTGVEIKTIEKTQKYAIIKKDIEN